MVAARGVYTGKPRPALIVQADLFNPTHASLTICPITSACVDAPMFRITLPAGARTGLRTMSQVMVDRIVSVPRTTIDGEIGHCDETEMAATEEALRRWLALD